MKVTLINYSRDANDELTIPFDLQNQIAFCARVSNPTNQTNHETSEKLLKYLIKHHHWSPFEMVSACLEIVTTRDIARQILRHRSFSFQEFSQRYAQATSFELRDARLQDVKNRQNSIETDDEELERRWVAKQQDARRAAQSSYLWALDNGIAKEQARCVLPEGMTQSTMYMNGTIRSWIHYVQLRTDKDTQKEHREVAQACADALEPIFPLIKDESLINK